MREKIRNYMAYVCIFLAAFGTGLQSLALPGVYYDAVYPDYLGAIGAFPGQANFTQITSHLGLPLLGNFYHGTITAGVQYLVLKCVGHASVYTLRGVNLFYIAVLGCLIFYVIRKVSNQFIVALGAAVLCVTAENIFTMSRTQFYIMLPGAVFFLFSVCFLFDLIKMRNRRVGILMAGFFQGLAFYGYFSYIFMAPISCLLLCMREKEKKYADNILLYGGGILIGSMGYFCGYYDSAIVNLVGRDVKAYILLYAGIVFVMYLLYQFTLMLIRTPEKLHIKFSRGGVTLITLGSVVTLIGGVFTLYRFMPDKIDSLVRLFSTTRDRVGGGRR